MNGQRILGDTIKYPAKSFPGFFLGENSFHKPRMNTDEHG